MQNVVDFARRTSALASAMVLATRGLAKAPAADGLQAATVASIARVRDAVKRLGGEGHADATSALLNAYTRTLEPPLPLGTCTVILGLARAAHLTGADATAVALITPLVVLGTMPLDRYGLKRNQLGRLFPTALAACAAEPDCGARRALCDLTLPHSLVASVHSTL